LAKHDITVSHIISGSSAGSTKSDNIATTLDSTLTKAFNNLNDKLASSIKKALRDGLIDINGKAQASTATKATAQQAKIIADTISKTIAKEFQRSVTMTGTTASGKSTTALDTKALESVVTKELGALTKVLSAASGKSDKASIEKSIRDLNASILTAIKKDPASADFGKLTKLQTAIDGLAKSVDNSYKSTVTTTKDTSDVKAVSAGLSKLYSEIKQLTSGLTRLSKVVESSPAASADVIKELSQIKKAVKEETTKQRSSAGGNIDADKLASAITKSVEKGLTALTAVKQASTGSKEPSKQTDKALVSMIAELHNISKSLEELPKLLKASGATGNIKDVGIVTKRAKQQLDVALNDKDIINKLSKLSEKLTISVDIDDKELRKTVDSLVNSLSGKVTVQVAADTKTAEKEIDSLVKDRDLKIGVDGALNKKLKEITALLTIIDKAASLDVTIDTADIKKELNSVIKEISSGTAEIIVSPKLENIEKLITAKFPDNVKLDVLLDLNADEAAKALSGYFNNYKQAISNLKKNLESLKGVLTDSLSVKTEAINKAIRTGSFNSPEVKKASGEIAALRSLIEELQNTTEVAMVNQAKAGSQVVDSLVTKVRAIKTDDLSSKFEALERNVAEVAASLTKLSDSTKHTVLAAPTTKSGTNVGVKSPTIPDVNVARIKSIGNIPEQRAIYGSKVIKPAAGSYSPDSMKQEFDKVSAAKDQMAESVQDILKGISTSRASLDVHAMERQLSNSLNALLKDITKTVTEQLGKSDWKPLEMPGAPESSKYFTNVSNSLNQTNSKMWTMQIADIKSMQKELTKSKRTATGDPNQIVSAFKELQLDKLMAGITHGGSTDENTDLLASKVATWMKSASKENIAGWTTVSDPEIKKALLDLKTAYETSKGSVNLVEGVKKAVGSQLGPLTQLTRQTYAVAEVNRGLADVDTTRREHPAPYIRNVALPAARMTPSGTPILETAHGSERALSKFAMFETGLEKLYSKALQAGTLRREEDYTSKIQSIGVNPQTRLEQSAVSDLVTKLLADISTFKPNESPVTEHARVTKEFSGIKEGYKAAAVSTMVQKKRIDPDLDIQPTLTNINKQIDQFTLDPNKDLKTQVMSFVNIMNAAQVSAYDFAKALDKVEFKNIYDIYGKVLEAPLKKLVEKPAYQSGARGFESATKQVEQLMPLIEPGKPRRGLQQSNVVNLLSRGTPGLYPTERDYELKPEEHKNYIKDLNLRFKEMYAERDMLAKLATESPESTLIVKRLQELPSQGRKLASLGIPESQASSIAYLKSNKVRGADEDNKDYEEGLSYLKALGGTNIKMFVDDLTSMAPFGEFQQLGRNIAGVTNAMSSSIDEINGLTDKFGVSRVKGLGTTTPTLRTEREKSLIEGGRYGEKGYGFNVTAELRHTSGTFEDQILVSGKLADAVTSLTKTLVLPAAGGRMLGKELSTSGKGTEAVSDVKPGVLKDVDSADAINKVYSQFQDMMGVSNTYKGRADKAFITEVQKSMATVRSENVEVQAAKVAEVFMNHFGRKFTTRFGSKGVSMTSTDTSKMSDILKTWGDKNIKVLTSEEQVNAGLGTAKMPKSMGQLAAELLDSQIEGLTASGASQSEVEGLKSQLINSGNKFMIEYFKDATSGLTVPEEATIQQDIYNKAKELFSSIGIAITDGVDGINNLKQTYSSMIKEGGLYELKPIDVRISSLGAGKRGLQTEVLETILNNVANVQKASEKDEAHTTLRDTFDPDMYKKLLGGGKESLSTYSSALGFKGTDPGKAEKELTKIFMQRGKQSDQAAVMAKRGAALEEMSNFYSEVIDEFGEKRKSLVGQKFLQVVEEPTATEAWSTTDVRKRVKGAKLNVPAYTAYLNVFGKDSELMKEINQTPIQGAGSQADLVEQLSDTDKKHWEYIKTLIANTNKDSEVLGALRNKLDKVSVDELNSFDYSTGTLDKGKRSMLGTVMDVEKFNKPFMLQLPSPDASKAKLGQKPTAFEDFYVPSPAGRGVYPEPLVAGEFGPEEPTRVLQNLINSAKDYQDFVTNTEQYYMAKNVDSRKTAEAVMKEAAAGMLKSSVLSTTSDIRVKGGRLSTYDPKYVKELEQMWITFKKNINDALSESMNKSYASSMEGVVQSQANYAEKRYNAILKSLRHAGATVSSQLSEGKVPFKTDPKGNLLEQLNTISKDFSGGKGMLEQEMNNKLAAVQKAKINYLETLAETTLGKSGSVAETLFTRKIPAVMAKAVSATVDKTKDLETFDTQMSAIISDLEGLSPEMQQEMGISEKSIKYLKTLQEQTQSIKEKHSERLKRTSELGLPILGQHEIGVPAEIARKIPVSFTKKFTKEGEAAPATKVEGTLLDMLRYTQDLQGKGNTSEEKATIKKYIEEELAPYIESLRYPFTGTSSIQPYKAKLLGEGKGGMASNVLAVPGMPNLPMDALSGVIQRVTKQRESLSTVRATELGKGAAASPEKLAKLTDLIDGLNAAISNLLPKYIAHQQKLDFDGDAIEIHSAINLKSRNDIKKHYDTLTQDLTDTASVFRDQFTYGAVQPPASEYTLAEMGESFAKKFPTEKGFSFMQKPFATEDMGFLSLSEQLQALAGDSKDLNKVLEQVSNMLDKTDADKLETAVSNIKDLSNADELKNNADKIAEVVETLDDKFKKSFKFQTGATLANERTKSAVAAQLFKIHTGPETEAFTRLSLSYNKDVSGGSSLIGAKGDQKFSRDEQSRMNELTRFSLQKGMDVKHAGAASVSSDITKDIMELGGGEKVYKNVLNNKDYEDLKDFVKADAQAITDRIHSMLSKGMTEDVQSMASAYGVTADLSDIDKFTAEMVDKMGFRGFLTRLEQSIRNSALDTLQKQIAATRGKGMSPDTLKAAAEEEYTRRLKESSPSAVASSLITSKEAPLYKFRTAGATTESQAGAYISKHGKGSLDLDVGIAKLQPGSYGKKEEARYSSSMAKAVATAANLEDELNQLYEVSGSGAYGELVKTSADRLKNSQKDVQAATAAIANYEPLDVKSIQDSIGKLTELTTGDLADMSPIHEQVFKDRSSAKDLMRMRDVVDYYTTLAGLPVVEPSVLQEIELLGKSELSKIAETKFKDQGLTPEELQTKVDEYVKVFSEKMKSLYSLDRALKVFKTSSASGMDVAAMLPPVSSGRSAKGTAYPSAAGIEAVKVASPIMDADLTGSVGGTPPPVTPGISAPGAGVPGGPFTFTGGALNVHLQSIASGIGLFVGDTPPSSKTKMASEPAVDVEQLKKWSNQITGGNNELNGATYETMYRASALAGGGEYKSGFKREDFSEKELNSSQLTAIVAAMRGEKGGVPNDFLEASALVGQAIHAKIQKDIMSMDPSSAIEQFVALTTKAGTITGHIDVVMKNETTGEKYPIDIKTVGEGVKNAIGVAIQAAGTSDFPEVYAKLIEKGDKPSLAAAYKLLDVASQLNVYMSAIGSSKGEANYYSSTSKGTDTPEVVKFKQDPALLAKDVDAISKARRFAGKFRTTGSLEEQENAAKKASPLNISESDLKSMLDESSKHFESIKSAGGGRQRTSSYRPMTPKENEEKVKGFKLDETDSISDIDKLYSPKIASGKDVWADLENFITFHTAAKEFQRQVRNINYDEELNNLEKVSKDLSDIIRGTGKTGPDMDKFRAATDKFKQLATDQGGPEGERKAGAQLNKAWKLYRMAEGDYYLSQAKEAKKAYEAASTSKDFESETASYGKAQSAIARMRKFVSRVAGSRTDIYTEDKKFVMPEMARRLNVYQTPGELATKSTTPLGDDKQLQAMFENIVADLQKDNTMTPAVEKARTAVSTITGSNVKREMVDMMQNAEMLTRMGSDVMHAWDFDLLAEKLSRLRASLERYMKYNLTDDFGAAQKKNLETVIKYLKSVENSYTMINQSANKDWGEAGAVPVPKWLAPKEQLAMHTSNVEKVKEYFEKPQEAGGARVGEVRSYPIKVLDQTGQIVRNVVVDFAKYGKSLSDITIKERDLAAAMQGSNSGFRGAIGRAVKWGAASSVVYGGFAQLKQAISTLSEIEYGLATLKMMLNPLSADIEGLSAAAVKFAKQYGVGVTDILQSMNVFAQQGLTQAEIIDRTRVSTLAANVTTLKASEATEALTSAMKIYQEEGNSAMRFLDAWSEVEAKSAITAGDLANAIQKSASAAKIAGVTFDQLNGIVAAIGSTTRQSGKEVGTSLRFILRRLSAEKGPQQLGKLGIPVMEPTGQLRAGFNVLDDLSKKWKDLSNAQKLTTSQALGGTRQYNSLIALMDNWDQALRATKDSMNSKGSAERRNAELMGTYRKQLEQTKVALVELQMSIGKVALPAFKIGLSGVKTFLEALSAIPAPIKAAGAAFVTLLAYMTKGQQLAESLGDMLAGGKDFLGISGAGAQFSKELAKTKYELFGLGGGKLATAGLKTLGKFTTAGPEGEKTDVARGVKLSDFHSSFGKLAFKLQEVGKVFNSFVADSISTTGKGIASFGSAGKTVGTKLSSTAGIGETVADIRKRNSMTKEDVEKTVKELGIHQALKKLVSGGLAMGAEVAGMGSYLGGMAVKGFGDSLGDIGKKLTENLATDDTSFVAAVAPLLTTIAALVPAIKVLGDQYHRMTQSAQDYADSMYNTRSVQEDSLTNIKNMAASYDVLQNKIEDLNKLRDPGVQERRKSLSTYEAPIVTLGKAQEDVISLANQLAESNSNLVLGYDKVGNAVLKVSTNFADYFKVLDKSKTKQLAESEVDVASKFIEDLTKTGGSENTKKMLKDMASEIPVIGEMLAKGIKVAPAKAIADITAQLNKLLAIKAKSPMSSAIDKDIKKYQEALKALRTDYASTYKEFSNVLGNINTKGLDPNEVAKIFADPRLKEGYDVIVNMEPRLNVASLKGKINWQDVLGQTVMQRALPEAKSLGFTKELTKGKLESAGLFERQGKVLNNDIVLFMDDVTAKYNMAGKQAIVKLKETSDGVFEWVAQYFNTKTLKVEERSFDKNMQQLVENIFPANHIQDELTDKIEILNEFVAGAGAGIRAISAKDFKKEFDLGERFFSDVATTTLLQSGKGYTPTVTATPGKDFGESPFQKSWKKDFEEYYAKPMTKFRSYMEDLDKLKIEGLDDSSVTIANDLYKELENLTTILKNNQVVMQYRAVLADLTKTFEAGKRVVEENISVERSRQEVFKGTAGYLKGISEGLDTFDTGGAKYKDLTVQQRTLIGSEDYRNLAAQLKELDIRKQGAAEGIYSSDKALVALDSIAAVSKGFGSVLTKDEMQNFTETVARTGDTGYAELKIETSRVATNTADTVTKLEDILMALGSPGDLDKQLEKYMSASSPQDLLTGLERVAEMRDRASSAGNPDMVIAANKVLDVMTKNLTSQLGVDRTLKEIGGQNVFGAKNYTATEASQRMFSGLDFNDFVTQIKDVIPEESKWFGLKTVPNKPSFIADVESINKLQTANQKPQLIDDKTVMKATAAASVAAAFQKAGENATVKKLDEQLQILKAQLAAEEAKPEVNQNKGLIDDLKTQEKTLTASKEDTTTKATLYGAVSTMTASKTAIMEFAKSLGFADDTIKKLGAGTVATYAAILTFSKLLGTDLSEATKNYGKILKDVATGVANTGEAPSLLQAIKLKRAEKTFYADYEKNKSQYGFSDGGRVFGAGTTMKMAAGGLITGEGTGTSDDILAKVSNGEYIINADAAKYLGQSKLDYMNEHGKLPAFASGGAVGGPITGPDINRPAQILATTAAATMAGYLAESNEKLTEIATASKKSAAESALISKLIQKNTTSAQKIFDALNEQNIKSKTAVEVLQGTEVKSKVLDVDAEKKKVEQAVKDMRETYKQQTQIINKQVSAMQEQMLKLEMSEELKKELDDMATAIANVEITANAKNRFSELVSGTMAYGVKSFLRPSFWSSNFATPQPGGLLSGKYNPPQVDLGVRSTRDMSTEQYLVFQDTELISRAKTFSEGGKNFFTNLGRIFTDLDLFAKDINFESIGTLVDTLGSIQDPSKGLLDLKKLSSPFALIKSLFSFMVKPETAPGATKGLDIGKIFTTNKYQKVETSFKELEKAQSKTDLMQSKLTELYVEKQELEALDKTVGLSGKEKKRLKNVDVLIDEYERSIKGQVSKIKNIKIDLDPVIIEGAFKKARSERASTELVEDFSSITRSISQSKTSMTAAMNPELSGFRGDLQFKRKDAELSDQEYFFKSAQGPTKNAIDQLKSTQALTESVGKKIADREQLIADVRLKLLDAGDKETVQTKEYKEEILKLSDEISVLTEDFGTLKDSMAALGSITQTLFDTGKSLRAFNESFKSLSVQGFSAGLEGTRNLKLAMDSLVGASGPFAKRMVTPTQQMGALMDGGVFLGKFADEFEIRTADLYTQLFSSNLKGNDLQKVIDQITYMPQEKTRVREEQDLVKQFQGLDTMVSAINSMEDTLIEKISFGNEDDGTKTYYANSLKQLEELKNSQAAFIKSETTIGELKDKAKAQYGEGTIEYQRYMSQFGGMAESTRAVAVTPEVKEGFARIQHDLEKSLITSDPVVKELVNIQKILEKLAEKMGVPVEELKQLFKTSGETDKIIPTIETPSLKSPVQKYLQEVEQNSMAGMLAADKALATLSVPTGDLYTELGKTVPIIVEFNKALGNTLVNLASKAAGAVLKDINVVSPVTAQKEATKEKATFIGTKMAEQQGFEVNDPIIKARIAQFAAGQAMFISEQERRNARNKPTGEYTGNVAADTAIGLTGVAGAAAVISNAEALSAIASYFTGPTIGPLLTASPMLAAAGTKAYSMAEPKVDYLLALKDTNDLLTKAEKESAASGNVFEKPSLNLPDLENLHLGDDKYFDAQIKALYNNTTQLQELNKALGENPAESVPTTTIGKAAGGHITGPGGPREDKVPAMLSPGEYVIRAHAAQKLGYDTLDHMNKKGTIPVLAEGGSITASLRKGFYSWLTDVPKPRTEDEKPLDIKRHELRKAIEQDPDKKDLSRFADGGIASDARKAFYSWLTSVPKEDEGKTQLDARRRAFKEAAGKDPDKKDLSRFADGGIASEARKVFYSWLTSVPEEAKGKTQLDARRRAMKEAAGKDPDKEDLARFADGGSVVDRLRAAMYSVITDDTKAKKEDKKKFDDQADVFSAPGAQDAIYMHKKQLEAAMKETGMADGGDVPKYRMLSGEKTLTKFNPVTGEWEPWERYVPPEKVTSFSPSDTQGILTLAKARASVLNEEEQLRKGTQTKALLGNTTSRVSPEEQQLMAQMVERKTAFGDSYGAGRVGAAEEYFTATRDIKENVRRLAVKDIGTEEQTNTMTFTPNYLDKGAKMSSMTAAVGPAYTEVEQLRNYLEDPTIMRNALSHGTDKKSGKANPGYLPEEYVWQARQSLNRFDDLVASGSTLQDSPALRSLRQVLAGAGERVALTSTIGRGIELDAAGQLNSMLPMAGADISATDMGKFWNYVSNVVSKQSVPKELAGLLTENEFRALAAKGISEGNPTRIKTMIDDYFKARSLDKTSNLLSDTFKDNKKSEGGRFMPIMHDGGVTRSTGPHYLEKGEVVLPRRFADGGLVNNELTTNTITNAQQKSVVLTWDESKKLQVEDRVLRVEDKELKLADIAPLKVEDKVFDVKLDDNGITDKLTSVISSIPDKISLDSSNVKLDTSNLEAMFKNLADSINNTKSVGADSTVLDTALESIAFVKEQTDEQIHIIDSKITNLQESFGKDVQAEINVRIAEVKKDILNNNSKLIDSYINRQRTDISKLKFELTSIDGQLKRLMTLVYANRNIG
jgi:TP901 family phage tail tape measure protein